MANYGLDHWLAFTEARSGRRYPIDAENCYRQYQQYSKVQTMLKNNLILLDTAFLTQIACFRPPRADGSEKWVDFVATFWHCECVCAALKSLLLPTSEVV